jgi:hypothetical protein
MCNNTAGCSKLRFPEMGTILRASLVLSRKGQRAVLLFARRITSQLGLAAKSKLSDFVFAFTVVCRAQRVFPYRYFESEVAQRTW